METDTNFKTLTTFPTTTSFSAYFQLISLIIYLFRLNGSESLSEARDEGAMKNYYLSEALGRSFRDITGIDEVFGEKAN